MFKKFFTNHSIIFLDHDNKNFADTLIQKLTIIGKKLKLIMDNKIFDYIELKNGSRANIITTGVSQKSESTKEIATALFEYTRGAKK